MNQLSDSLQKLIDFLRKYGITLAILSIGLVYGYLIYNSGKLAQAEPSEVKINEKYQGAKRPKIDKVIIDKLNELEDHNVKFQALIDEARNNPFSE